MEGTQLKRSDQGPNCDNGMARNQDRIDALVATQGEVLGVLPVESPIKPATINEFDAEHALLSHPALNQAKSREGWIKASCIHDRWSTQVKAAVQQQERSASIKNQQAFCCQSNA